MKEQNARHTEEVKRKFDGRKRPEEVEADLEQTRAEMDYTIEALLDRVTPGALLNQAIDWWRSGTGSEYGRNLGTTVKNNPLPLTLLGVSLAWLMMSGREGPHYSSNLSTDVLKEKARGARESMRHRSERVRESVRHGSERMRESVEHGKERLQGAYHTGAEKGAEVREGGGSAVSGAQERLSKARAGVRDTGYRVKSSFQDTLQNQPMVLAGLGIALGALAGALFPSTRREDELMGRKRDELLEKARAEGRAQVEEAARVAETAGHAAVEKARSEVHHSGGSEPPSGGGSAP